MAKNNRTTNLQELITNAFLLLASIYVLIFGLGDYTNIQHAKYIAFLAIFGGYCLSMIILNIETVMIGQRKATSPKEWLSQLSWSQKLIMLYLLFSVLSTIVSSYRNEAFIGMTRNEGLLTIAIYCITFLLVSKYSNPKSWLKYAFGVIVAIFTIICFMQLCGINIFGLYPFGTNYYGANIDYAGAYIGTIGNTDLVAGFLCLTFPICLNSKKIWPVAAAVAALIFFIDVSAGALALIVGSLVISPLLVPEKHRKLTTFFVIGIVVICILLLFIVPFSSGVLHEAHEILHGNFDDAFGNGRLMIWKKALSACKSHLLFGYGPDTMAALGLEGYSVYTEAVGQDVQFLIDVAHNEYLNILFSQGIFALLSYIFALILIFQRSIKHRNNKTIVLFSFSILLYLIQAFFSFSMCSVAALFWVALGLLEKYEEG